MTDREMLEFAAKAAGKDMEYMQWDGFRFVEQKIHGVPHCGLNYEETWNPLTDDGDALRLAVDLGITIGIEYGRKHAHANGLIEKPVNGDLHAATRRTITRASSEIGKRMP